MDVLFAQFDACALGPCGYYVYEDRQPGALAALQSWAHSRRLSVRDRPADNMEGWTAYEVEVPQWNHLITVYVPFRAPEHRTT